VSAAGRFLLDAQGTILRIADSAYESMLGDPANHRLPAFAGQRVRMAHLMVELLDWRLGQHAGWGFATAPGGDTRLRLAGGNSGRVDLA